MQWQTKTKDTELFVVWEKSNTSSVPFPGNVELGDTGLGEFFLREGCGKGP
jgi:hypothetical protein